MTGQFLLPPFALSRPTGAAGPLVVASPHSGSHYPADLVAASRLGGRALRTSEDSFVNELFMRAPGIGAPLIEGLYARAYLDLNREPYELDPSMFVDKLPDFVNSASPRVAVGLGTIARVVAEGQAIYQRKLRFAEAEARIERLHRPYHEALDRLIGEAFTRHGYVILLDAHSMPSVTGTGSARGQSTPRVDIVLGDRMGSSCHPIVIATAESLLLDRGYRVIRNVPYAGGFTTRHYGVPDEGRHCLQIEINRDLYMDETNFEKRAGFARIAGDMGSLLLALRNIAPDRLRSHGVEAAQ